MRKVADDLLPDVDILHIHEFRTLENLLVTPVTAALGTPIVLSPHGTLALSTGRSRFKRIWDRMLSAGVALRIDHVLALTENELRDIQALWTQFGHRRAPTQFSILANGVNPDEYARLPDPEAFRQRYQLGDAPVALFIGRLQQRKGLDILVRAFQRAGVEHARLLIVGPDEGMLPAIQRLVAGDSRIVCTGFLSGEERSQALAASQLLALPAVGEGLPMAVLEAMASGMPVVISPGCNLPEVAPAGAGFVVDATVEAFADKLRLLLRERDLRQDMGAKARRLVEQKHSWNGIAAELEGVYRLLAAERSR